MYSAKLWNDSFDELRGIPGFHLLLGIWQNIEQTLFYPQKYAAEYVRKVIRTLEKYESLY